MKSENLLFDAEIKINEQFMAFRIFFNSIQNPKITIQRVIILTFDDKTIRFLSSDLMARTFVELFFYFFFVIDRDCFSARFWR
jgi:hypothetical protein